MGTADIGGFIWVAVRAAAFLLFPYVILWLIYKYSEKIFGESNAAEEPALKPNEASVKHGDNRERQKMDSLTGLLNAESGSRLIKDIVEDCMCGGGSLIIVNIDYFRYVNEVLGYKRGDDVLINVSDIIKSGLRERDVLARFIKDSFIVWMDGIIEKPDIYEVCRCICENVRELKYGYGDDKTLRVTVSIGAASASGRADFKRLMRDADKALLCAKDSGRNGYYFMGRQ